MADETVESDHISAKVTTQVSNERRDAPSSRETSPPPVSALPEVSAKVTVLELGAGLYLVNLRGTGAAATMFGGMAMPVTYITGAPSGSVNLMAAAGHQVGWLGPEGGAIVASVTSGGGFLWITTYRMADQQFVPVEIQLTRLDEPGPRVPAAARELPSLSSAPLERAAPPMGRSAQSGGDIGIEVIVHLERLGDRTFSSGQWIGNQGRKRRIEAFGIRPLDVLSPQDIEYKAFGPDGRETSWVTDAKLCGTRGQAIPIIGFAIRLAPSLRDRYDAIYEGAFFDGGVSGPKANGELCASPRFDDPLEDMRVRVLRKEPGRIS
jgi:hypothetical protein